MRNGSDQTRAKSGKGFARERRRDGVSELSRLRGSEGYEVRVDEVKLERAQGECLGIRSR